MCTCKGSEPLRSILETRLAEALDSVPKGSLCIVAVSGGADSTALLAAAAAVAARESSCYALCCLHVEHGIRPSMETKGDARFVAELCRVLGVPFHLVSIKPGRIARIARDEGIGLEAAARKVRHSAWNALARKTGAAGILVGHTQDDALETIAMRFLRGSGPRGLACMPMRKDRIIRPFIHSTRAEILEYLENRNISYRSDSTNLDSAILRNRIRLRLLPLLERDFPQWRRALLSVGETQGRVADCLDSLAAERVLWEECREKSSAALRTPERPFFIQDPLVREEALFQGIDRLRNKYPGKRRAKAGGGADGPENPAASPRRAVLRAFSEGRTVSVDLGDMILGRSDEWVVLRPKDAGKDPSKDSWGVSLCVGQPGRYRIGPLVITARVAQDEGPQSGDGGGAFAVGFYSEEPCVFRRPFPEDRIFSGGRLRPVRTAIDRKKSPGYDGLLVAEDQNGIAAAIGIDVHSKLMLVSREKDVSSFPRAGGLFFSIYSRG